MFVHFRETARRLQASLVATRRIDGRVRHEHVAGLGSVPGSPSPADRIAFSTKLHQRLDGLRAARFLTTILPVSQCRRWTSSRLCGWTFTQKDARFWSSLAEV
jgi:hypothetical protein